MLEAYFIWSSYNNNNNNNNRNIKVVIDSNDIALELQEEPGS